MAKKSGWLAGAYTVGALVVTLALLARAPREWSYKETICAAGTALTALVWFKWNASAAVFAGVLAMTIAGIPIWIDLWGNPIRSTWPLWFFTVVACIFSILGSDGTWTGNILAIGGIIFNGSLALIVLLKEPKKVTPSYRGVIKIVR